MTTTPEATKGVPYVVGNPTFTLRADLEDYSDWLLANVDSSVANVAALPASGNWKGRRRYVEADGRGRVHDGTNWVEPKAAYADLRRTAALNATTTFSNIAWDTEEADPLGWHSTGTNPERITADRAGLYQVSANLELSSAAVAMQAILLKNGGTRAHTLATNVGGGSNTRVILTDIVPLSAGDYITVAVYVGSTTAMFVSHCYVQVTYLGS